MRVRWGLGGCRWGGRPERRRGLAWRVGVLVAVLVGLVLAADFRVRGVETHLVDGAYLLDADIDFRFSPTALEALANGVPLTILMHFQVRPADAWIWSSNVTELQLRYAIRLKPLSETYQVYRLPGSQGRSFVNRDAAIAALGEIRGLHLIDQARLTPGQSYEVHLKVSLDIEALPLPLRPTAYLSPAWKLDSHWTKWPLNP